MRKFGKAMLVGALALAFFLPNAHPVAAQSGGENQGPAPIATGDRVYCGGFVSETPVNTDIRIVAGVREASVYFYVNGERAFINKGRSQGVQVGNVYQMVRPRGAFYHPFKTKLKFPSFERRGNQLGYYNEEIGFARVIAVQDNTSTIEVIESCTEGRLGDVLIQYEKPKMPDQRAFRPLDPLSVPSGKTTGQIIFARNNREELSSSDVVIVDLGQKAGVKVGDYFTIFREQGSEPVTKIRDDEVSFKRMEIGSDRYRGSNYSIVHPSIQKEKLKEQYPGSVFPRTIVGELVVTRVEGNTATAVITRTQGGQVLMGDQIELQ